MIKKTFAKVRDKALENVAEDLSTLEQKLNGHELMINHIMFTANNMEYNLSTRPIIMPISEKEIMAKIFNGIKFNLDPRDISVATHLAMDGIWEDFITKAWLRVLKPESVVFDIGANFGYFGVLAANGINRKKSKVVFFEPNPHLLPYIHKTLSTNWLNENAVVENLGIADKPGKFELSILKDYVGSSSMHSIEHLSEYAADKMQLEVAEKIPVTTTTVDAYCAEKGIEAIDLIKIDIEGFEEKAFEGMRGMVKKSPDLIMFLEFTKESYDDPQGFYAKMRNDFKYMYTISPDGHFVTPKNVEYHEVFDEVQDWLMLVFSHKPLK